MSNVFLYTLKLLCDIKIPLLYHTKKIQLSTIFLNLEKCRPKKLDIYMAMLTTPQILIIISKIIVLLKDYIEELFFKIIEMKQKSKERGYKMLLHGKGNTQITIQKNMRNFLICRWSSRVSWSLLLCFPTKCFIFISPSARTSTHLSSVPGAVTQKSIPERSGSSLVLIALVSIYI